MVCERDGRDIKRTKVLKFIIIISWYCHHKFYKHDLIIHYYDIKENYNQRVLLSLVVNYTFTLPALQLTSFVT